MVPYTKYKIGKYLWIFLSEDHETPTKKANDPNGVATQDENTCTKSKIYQQKKQNNWNRVFSS